MKGLKSGKRLARLGLTVLTLVSLSFSVVQAAVAFSYQGWGIRGTNSLGSTYLAKRQSVTIKHYQRRDYNRSGVGLQVTIQRHNGWTWVNAHSRTFYETRSATYSTTLNQGTYRLYFNTTSSGQSYYISGTFNK